MSIQKEGAFFVCL